LNGAQDVRLLIHRPSPDVKGLPAILYCHGGGFVAGTPDMMAVASMKLASEQNAVVIAIKYRLAPETPFPGPVEDYFAALKWMAAEADTLGIDVARIVSFGQSAGGGLAAATAQMALDRNGPALKVRFLLYPMLDARTGTGEAPIDNPVTGTFGGGERPTCSPGRPCVARWDASGKSWPFLASRGEFAGGLAGDLHRGWIARPLS